jgi:hypothetical protein
VKRADQYRLQAARHSGGLDSAPEWLAKRCLSFNPFIVTALPAARIAALKSQRLLFFHSPQIEIYSLPTLARDYLKVDFKRR